MKDIVEKEAEEEQQQKDVDLTPYEHKLKGEYRRFMMPGKPKTDINSCFNQAEPHMETLIENQLKEIGSAKIIMTLYVIWKKLKKLDDGSGDK